MVATVTWRTTRRKLSPPSASAFAPSSVLLPLTSSSSYLLPRPHRPLLLTSLFYFLVPLSHSSTGPGTYPRSPTQTPQLPPILLRV